MIPEYPGAMSYNVRVWVHGPADQLPIPLEPGLLAPGWHEVIETDHLYAGLRDVDDYEGVWYREYHLWTEDQYAYTQPATGMVWYRLFVDATILQSYQFHSITAVPETYVVDDPDSDGWYDYFYTPIMNGEGAFPIIVSDYFFITYPDDPVYPILWPANISTQY